MKFLRRGGQRPPSFPLLWAAWSAVGMLHTADALPFPADNVQASGLPAVQSSSRIEASHPPLKTSSLAFASSSPATSLDIASSSPVPESSPRFIETTARRLVASMAQDENGESFETTVMQVVTVTVPCDENGVPLVMSTMFVAAGTVIIDEAGVPTTTTVTETITVPCDENGVPIETPGPGIPSEPTDPVAPVDPTSDPLPPVESSDPVVQPSQPPSPTTDVPIESSSPDVQPSDPPLEPSSSAVQPSSSAVQPSSSLVDSSTQVIPSSSADPAPTVNPPAPNPPTGADVFSAIAVDAPPSHIGSRGGHMVSRGSVEGSGPIQTNKFYANFFLGGQSSPTWTHPYSLAWSKGGGYLNSWGMSVSHTERGQVVYGQGSPARYFYSPTGIQSFIFSAKELGSSTTLKVRNPKQFSAEIELSNNGGSPLISFPVVQGMGFITANYQDAKPLLQSAVRFRTFTRAGMLNGNTAKYRLGLEDGTTWLMYVTPVGSAGIDSFSLLDGSLVEGPQHFTGIIQIAKNPIGPEGEQIYDASAGAYAVEGKLTGAVDGAQGSYTMAWSKGGDSSRPLLMFALPHHVDTFDAATASKKTTVRLQTTTKGIATAVQADQFTMVEANLPDSMGFDPWSPDMASGVTSAALSTSAARTIYDAAKSELQQDMDAQSNLDSMYFSGKALAKFASVVYAASRSGDTLGVSEQDSIVTPGLNKLKSSFARFVENRQIFPLAYDTVWKGVVSTASYVSGDLGFDFGNTAYNDHQFHYGYHVFTAAVIAHLDKAWLSQGNNKAWVNMLVRDFDNPSEADTYFPVSRSMDWYHGHSWAKGLFESGDGKDLESTSEDAFATYAVKMWAKVIGDANMEARANLQMAVKARAIRAYFLMDASNTNQPLEFIANRVTGILFENKVDYTTYFGANFEYIHGIHMIPISPVSAYVRTKAFAKLEWDHYFNDAVLSTIKSGWRGIVEANRAIFDPKKAYQFFSAPNFDSAYIDGGASRAWYLMYAAGMGGA